MKYLGGIKNVLVFVIFIITSCEKKNDDQSIDLSTDLINSNNLIREVMEEIKNNYAGNVEREKLEAGAINGMLKALDDYSTYITQDEFDAFNKSTRGVFLGIGIDIKQEKEGIEVLSVIDESPAAIAGLKAADVITSIDDEDILKMEMKDVISKFNSDHILKTKISVLRNKTEKLDFKLKKSVIQLQSVKLDFVGDIAIIKITYFNEGTVDEVSRAVKKLLKKKSTGVIIDLRNNPGGILEQAISVCDLFLVDKKIVEFKSRHTYECKTIFANDTDLLNGLTMAVLIDSNTASGGELVAAALGDNKRAVLLGEKTYGKGALQTIIPIPSRGALKLTTAYFVSPNGNVINQAGVTPDVEITKSPDQERSIVKSNGKNSKRPPIILRAIDLLHGIVTPDSAAKQ